MTKFRINPGKYKHIVTFQRRTSDQNGYGEKTEDNWFDVFTARVSINPVSGKEVFTAEYMASEISHRILMRYTLQPIDSTMRIRYGARTFLLVAPPINYQEANVEIQLLCKEVI